MINIQVKCYAGYIADQRPVQFTIGGKHLEVVDLDGQWYSPNATYFRVLASDGNYYVLRHDDGQDCWTLDGYRAPHKN